MKAKKIIIAVVAILVILGGTFAGLWFFTDVFNFLKPADDVFSNQLEKAFNLEGVKFSNYSDFLKEYKEMSNKSVSGKINLKANLNISNLDPDIQKTINNSEIQMEVNSDSANKKQQNKIGLYSNNSEVLTLDFIKDDSKIGIGCDELYDKYVTSTMEDLVKFVGDSADLSSDELDMLLNNNLANLDPYELLYISDDDLKHFDDTYKDCFKTSISKDCYSTEKNVEVEVDDKDVKTTAYYLTLTGKDAYEFVDKLVNLIEDDDVIVKILTEKVNLVLEASSQEKISEDDVKELISKMAQYLSDELESIKDETDSAVQIAVYSDKSNPVRIEFNLIEDVEDSDDKKTALSIEYAKNKTIYTLMESITLVNEYTKNSDEEKAGKIELFYSSNTSLGSLEYEIISKDDESKIDLSLDIPSQDISANINFSTKGNYKKEEVSFTGSISFEYGRESAEINMDGSINYDNAGSIPDLTSSNSVNVFDLSETEAENLYTEILTNASKVLPSRLKLLGIDIDETDILPTTPTTENADTNLGLDTNLDDNSNLDFDINLPSTIE